jgi:mono/diheme cytochrome c family protein
LINRKIALPVAPVAVDPVAHALVRAVFALMRTRFSPDSDDSTKAFGLSMGFSKAPGEGVHTSVNAARTSACATWAATKDAVARVAEIRVAEIRGAETRVAVTRVAVARVAKSRGAVTRGSETGGAETGGAGIWGTAEAGRYGLGVAALALLMLLTACRQDMQNQPRYKPLAGSDFFSDERSARPMVEGTVARGHLRIDEARYTGKIAGEDIDQFPIPIAKADIERGQSRFNIYCSPCHGRLGDGNGMVVLRGFRQPPSYYSDRLVHAPVGHFFDVITNGFGAMPSYASRVQSDDRWRIIAYVRALQLSESATQSDVPPDQLQTLQVEPPPRVAGSSGPPPGPEGVHQ